MLRAFLYLFTLPGVPRLFMRLMLDRRVSLGLKLIPAAAVVYFVSPLDFIRDMVPAIGRIDDMVVLVLALVLFLALSPKSIVLEHLNSSRRGVGPEGKGSGKEPDVIDGSYRVVDDEEDQA